MPLPDRYPVRNVSLRALAPDDLGSLRPHLDPVPFGRGDVVIHPDEPFEHAWFPEGGLASVVSTPDGEQRLELGMFGREGMVPTGLVLGSDRTPLETFVQVEGAWLRIGADVLRDAMRRSPALHGLLMRYVQTFMLLVGQTALANGLYKTEERLARWLLMAHDRADGDELPLTQDFLSMMLAVRRSGVTIAAGILQKAGLIRYVRGRITVLDRPGLEAAACECHGAVRREYARLLPDAGGARRGHDAESAAPRVRKRADRLLRHAPT